MKKDKNAWKRDWWFLLKGKDLYDRWAVESKNQALGKFEELMPALQAGLADEIEIRLGRTLIFTIKRDRQAERLGRTGFLMTMNGKRILVMCNPSYCSDGIRLWAAYKDYADYRFLGYFSTLRKIANQLLIETYAEILDKYAVSAAKGE